jgi:hypothetical protein
MLLRLIVYAYLCHRIRIHFRMFMNYRGGSRGGTNLDIVIVKGRIQDFKLGEAHLKKLRRAEGGAKNVGVFRAKNHDFTPKNHIFSN